MKRVRSKRDIVDVRIRDIERNPYRDLTTYAIQEDKVSSLIESINETGFWENVVGRRRADGKIEIAYGHHRLAAAKRVFRPDDTIPIIIKPLTDDQMRKMMIRENKAEYGCLPAAIDDAVKAARDYLQGNRDEAEKLLKADRSDVKRVRVGAPAIAKYTGFPKSTVESSLRRLEWTETGKVDREAIYKMPHQEAAMRFAREVMDYKLSPNQQKIAADKNVEERKFGWDSIEQMIDRVKPLPIGYGSDPRYAGFYEIQLLKATRSVKAVIRMLGKFTKLNERPLIGHLPTDEDISEEAKGAFERAMSELSKQYQIVAEALEKNPEHGKPTLFDEDGEEEPAPSAVPAEVEKANA